MASRDPTGGEVPSFFEVGVRLRSLRESIGLSQRELARRADMTNASLSQIEHGKVSPSLQTLERVLRAIPCSLTDFFSGAQLFITPHIKQSTFTEWPLNGATIKGFVAPFSNRQALLFAHKTVPKGASLTFSWLPESRYVVGMLEAGEVELRLSGEEYLLEPGDGFRFSVLKEHSLCNVGQISAMIKFAVFQSAEDVSSARP